MTNKKRRAHPSLQDVLDRPWCYYCDRDFEDLRILCAHQKAKHYKCDKCHRRLNTVGGLRVHLNQVHKEDLHTVDNALPDRQDVNVEIFGMEGIPQDVRDNRAWQITQKYYQDEAAHRAATGNSGSGGSSQNPAKKSKAESTEDMKRRLAEHRAKKATGGAEAGGDKSQAGMDNRTSSPAVGNGSPPFNGSQPYGMPPQGSPPPGPFAPPPSGPPQYGYPQQGPPPQPNAYPPPQPGFGASPPPPPQPGFGYGPGQPYQPPGSQFSPPPQAAPYGAPAGYGAPPGPYGQPLPGQAPPGRFPGMPPPQPVPGQPPAFMPGQQPPHTPPQSLPPPHTRQSSLPFALGLPQRPDVQPPPIDNQQMQMMHHGQYSAPHENGGARQGAPPGQATVTAADIDDLIANESKNADQAAKAPAAPPVAEKKKKSKKEKGQTKLMYSDEQMSPEEKMAKLPRYAYTPDKKTETAMGEMEGPATGIAAGPDDVLNETR